MTSAPKKSKRANASKRVQFYIDKAGIRILDAIVKETPQIESRSAAVRFLIRWYEMTAHGRQV